MLQRRQPRCSTSLWRRSRTKPAMFATRWSVSYRWTGRSWSRRRFKDIAGDGSGRGMCRGQLAQGSECFTHLARRPEGRAAYWLIETASRRGWEGEERVDWPSRRIWHLCSVRLVGGTLVGDSQDLTRSGHGLPISACPRAPQIRDHPRGPRAAGHQIWAHPRPPTPSAATSSA